MDEERELELMRQQMEGTRESLADKLDALEQKVRGTVQDVEGAVSHTVEAVQQTVETVKETLDVRQHVQRHPWPMMGGAFALGFLGGWLVGRSRKEGGSSAPVVEEFQRTAQPMASHNGSHGRNGAVTEQPPEGTSVLEAGLEAVRGLAIGALMGLLRDVVAHAIPQEWAPEVTGVVDDWTNRLGGKSLPPREHESTTSFMGGTQHDQRGTAEMGRKMGTARWSGEEPVGGLDL